MKKVLYAASVIVLGAGLALAQSETSGGANDASPSSTTTDMQTPSASHSQTSSADTMDQQNQTNGQIQDLKSNPAPGSMSGHAESSDAADKAGVPSTGNEDNSSNNSMSADQNSSAEKHHHKK